MPAKKPRKGEKGGEEKKKKRKKASDGIKKPASAYIYFVSDYRKELKAQGEDTSNVQEVAKICGQKWREMDDDDKKPYVLQANKDKERYSKEVRMIALQELLRNIPDESIRIHGVLKNSAP